MLNQTFQTWCWLYCNWLNFTIHERNQMQKLQVVKSRIDKCDRYIKSLVFWKRIILYLVAQVIWKCYILSYLNNIFEMFSCMLGHCMFMPTSKIYCWILTGGSWRKRAPRSSWNSTASYERLKLTLTVISAVKVYKDLFC